MPSFSNTRVEAGLSRANSRTVFSVGMVMVYISSGSTCFGGCWRSCAAVQTSSGSPAIAESEVDVRNPKYAPSTPCHAKCAVQGEVAEQARELLRKQVAALLKFPQTTPRRR